MNKFMHIDTKKTSDSLKIEGPSPKLKNFHLRYIDIQQKNILCIYHRNLDMQVLLYEYVPMIPSFCASLYFDYFIHRIKIIQLLLLGSEKIAYCQI